MRDKLIETKQKWAREGRLLVPAPAERRRLPPGQRLVKDWPVLDLGTQPNLMPRDWQLTVGGLVDRPATLRWDDLRRLPTVETRSDIHCVTAWSRFVILRSFDSYATTVPLADFAGDDVLLATHWDGKPLTRGHGGPVRLVLPKLYFWKSAKWIRHLWFTDREVPGYWEARGYHKRGDPWAQQRYDS